MSVLAAIDNGRHAVRKSAQNRRQSPKSHREINKIEKKEIQTATASIVCSSHSTAVYSDRRNARFPPRALCIFLCFGYFTLASPRAYSRELMVSTFAWNQNAYFVFIFFLLPLSHLIQTQNKNKFRSTNRLRERVNEREEDGETIVVIQYTFVHLKWNYGCTINHRKWAQTYTEYSLRNAGEQTIRQPHWKSTNQIAYTRSHIESL